MGYSETAHLLIYLITCKTTSSKDQWSAADCENWQYDELSGAFSFSLVFWLRHDGVSDQFTSLPRISYSSPPSILTPSFSSVLYSSPSLSSILISLFITAPESLFCILSIPPSFSSTLSPPFCHSQKQRSLPEGQCEPDSSPPSPFLSSGTITAKSS